MPRRARLLLHGVPLHLIQRGNNRSACFYAEEDYLFYLDNLKLQAVSNRGQTTFFLRC
jgi:putative transposase